MATYRKVPARILTVDYVGVTTAESERLWKRAERELSRLEAQVLRGDLDQGTRKVSLGDNVNVECVVCLNIKQATVIIGVEAKRRVLEEPCYCCSPCLAAGIIISVNTNQDPTSPDYEKFLEDANYYADILLCQAPDSQTPRKITVYEERSSAGKSRMTSRVLQQMDAGGVQLMDVIFSDYQNHQNGDVVLVLVQPLYEFLPAPYGVYSPCINKRMIADELVTNPKVAITTDFVNSSGLSCKILNDSQIWDEEFDPPGDSKYQPFRILPIKIKSCL